MHPIVYLGWPRRSSTSIASSMPTANHSHGGLLRDRRNNAAATLRFALLALALVLACAAQAVAAPTVTNSGDDLRTGWYPEASAITPQLVSGGTFGQLWSAPVEGQVYAQPLLANGTLLVATEADKAYGLDPTTGAVKWSKALGTPWKAADIGCGDLTPTIGVTATPVIDAGVAYMTHKTYASGNSGPAKWFMDAIEMSSGAEKPGFPVELAGTAQNDPADSFQPTTELQRPGLLLMEGVVYAAFGSHCDIKPYQGWVFGVSESGAVKARWSDETSGSGAGIWQSGAGLTSDGPGTILLSTGNGNVPVAPTPGSSPPGSLGEAIVRLRVQGDGSLKATDFFAPYDAAVLNEWDADFASGGVTGLPSEYFGTASLPHLAVAVGKDGYVYLLNRDNLGGIGEGPSGSDDVVQRIGSYGGVWSRPAVWPGEGGWIYIPTASGGTSASGSSGNLRVYKYGLSGTGSPTLSLAATSSDAFGFSSSAPVITSEGTTAGSALVWIVWAPNGSGEGAQLRAYDPIPVGGKPVLRWSSPVGTSAKFAMPGVGAGKLFVGTRDGHVLAFGSPVTPVLSGPSTSFAATVVGSSREATLTLTANEALTIPAGGLSSSSAQFSIGATSPALPATLASGQKISVPIVFKPTSAGPQAGTLTAKTSTGKTATFSLSGNGQASGARLESSPTVLTFEGTTIGTSRSDSATFENVGSESLTITGVDAPPAPFSLEGAPLAGQHLAPGESISVTVNFEPTTVGKYENALSLETSAGPATVQLVATAGTPGHLQIEGESIDFGTVPLGASSPRSFTVTNTGGTSVEITRSKPPTGGEFSAQTELPEGTTIAPGETRAETVSFVPTAVGPASGEWSINGKDAGGVHSVRFSGVGAIAAAPSEQATIAPLLTGSTATGTAAGTPAQGVLAAKAQQLRLHLRSSALRASAAGTIAVELACVGSTRCSGTIALEIPEATAGARHGATAKLSYATLAKAKFAIAGGRTATIRLKLSAASRRLLARAGVLHARSVLVLQGATGGPLSTVVQVTIHAPPRRRSRG
jgi:Abnormal spindle-like microcephaly-assoc'd, ASPM-SPD-2-Hydin/PQQ-like domain